MFLQIFRYTLASMKANIGWSLCLGTRRMIHGSDHCHVVATQRLRSWTHLRLYGCPHEAVSSRMPLLPARKSILDLMFPLVIKTTPLKGAPFADDLVSGQAEQRTIQLRCGISGFSLFGYVLSIWFVSLTCCACLTIYASLLFVSLP